MESPQSDPFIDDLFTRFADQDGILRDTGLEKMLRLGGMDREMTDLILKRAQWMHEHYGPIALSHEDFSTFLCDPNEPKLYDGDRRGVKPLDRVPLFLGGPPSHSAALITAARLGLELENDVRVSSERLKALRNPALPRHIPLPPIRDPQTTFPPPIETSSSSEDEPDLNHMPLL